MPFEAIPWSEAGEVEALREFEAAMMPLPDELDERPVSLLAQAPARSRSRFRPIESAMTAATRARQTF